jgi:hypothetical protein
MKQPTLDEFIAAYGTKKYTPNLYVKEKGFRQLYVRMTPRYFRQGLFDPTLDLANFEVNRPGTGTFTRLVERLRKQYPHITLHVETVFADRFCDGLLRMGFLPAGHRCFVLFPQKEIVDIANQTGV